MKKSMILVGLLCVSLGGCAAMKGEDNEKEGTEVKVSMDQVPAAVKTTLLREAEGVNIATVDKETSEGKTIYEADAVIGGTLYEIKVAEDGKLISKAIDKEAQAATTQKAKN